MFSLFIRYFFVCLCAFFTQYQIIAQKRTLKSIIIFYLFTPSTISLIASSLYSYTATYRILFMLLTSFIIFSLHDNFPLKYRLNTTIISYGISYLSLIISGTTIGIICFLLYKRVLNVPFNITYILTGLLQFSLLLIIFKIKQFRNGIGSITRNGKSFNGSLLSLLMILYIAIISTTKHELRPLRAIIIFILLTLSISLYYYWRHRIKQTYIENLRRLENLTYENTIADKDKQIKELEANNAYLAQIIHKYRKVIPAMELSVMELLQNNANWDTNTLKSNAQALQVQLEELRAERNNLLDNYQKDMVVTPQSGLHTIDALIALMEKQAKEQWVRYKTQIDPSIKELALASVKEADLLHLLGDLIENALHAVNESDHKEILIHISKLNGCLLLEVSDSGAAFDIETYQHFGNEPFTSHEADGGSGTGLMEIWKLKKEYKISLYIYEYETDSNVYTKKISFLFDKKNHFLLKTYRDKEVKNALIRGDLHVFPHKND